jgi:hypothetical protein
MSGAGGASSLGGNAGTTASGGASGSGAGSGGAEVIDPYAPREGSFELLLYTRTGAFRTSSIPAGVAMVEDIAELHGFGLTHTETNDEFTAEALGRYEVVFFLNTSGDVLGSDEELAFEEWMIAGGAYIGSNRAADTEVDWAFYKELTGQYYDLHGPCCPSSDIHWEEDALEFPAVRGLPSPWTRGELWFYFDSYLEWSAKPGFRILGTVEIEGSTHPVSFVREWSNFRSFYSVLGHQESTFEDPQVRQHFEAAILWAVRREHWLE